MRTISFALMIIAALAGCSGKNMDDVTTSLPQAKLDTIYKGNGQKVSYLALGDSYTIGEAVPQELSFPYQLNTALNQNNYKAETPVIIARTGWTTDELIREISTRAIDRKFDIVTLLIGVNNQYRGYNIDTYRTEFVQLLITALKYANNDKQRVFVVSIPDWGVTPFASGRDRQQIATEIDRYNAIAREETQKAGVSFTDITPGSRAALNDASLIASDGLHPSGKMYANWVQQLIAPVAKSLK